MSSWQRLPPASWAVLGREYSASTSQEETHPLWVRAGGTHLDAGSSSEPAQENLDILERVQRRATKRLKGLELLWRMVSLISFPTSSFQQLILSLQLWLKIQHIHSSTKYLNVHIQPIALAAL